MVSGYSIDILPYTVLKIIMHKQKKSYDIQSHIKIEHMSLKRTFAKAGKGYPKGYDKETAEDSLFAIVGSFRTEDGNWSERDDWRE